MWKDARGHIVRETHKGPHFCALALVKEGTPNSQDTRGHCVCVMIFGVYVCVHIDMYTCICVCVCVSTLLQEHINVYICEYVCVCVRARAPVMITHE